jgi:hypothetical protein
VFANYVCCVFFRSTRTEVMVVSTVPSLCMSMCARASVPKELFVLRPYLLSRRTKVRDVSASISAVFFVCAPLLKELRLLCVTLRDRQRLGVSGSASVSAVLSVCVLSLLHISAHMGCAFPAHHCMCYVHKLLST